MRFRSELNRWVHLRWLVTSVGSAFVFVLVIGARQLGYIESIELTVYDAFIRFQPTVDYVPPIVLIAVTDTEIQELRQWPLTDEILAEALRTLVANEPRVIGLDIYRDIPVPPGTAQLERVLREHDEIIAVEKAPSASRIGISAPAVLKGTSRVGFNDITPDPAGVVRRSLLFMDDGKSVSYSFGLRLALLYLEGEGIFPGPGSPLPEFIRLGRTTLPPLEADHGGYANIDADGYQILLDFLGGPLPFQTYSLTDLRSDRLNKTSLKGKIVILGVHAESVKDIFYTPYDTQLNREGIPGIALHAHIANQLLRAALLEMAPRRSFSGVSEGLWILLWCILGGLLGMVVRTASVYAAIGAVGLVGLSGLAYVGFVVGWWIPSIPPAVAWITSLGLTAGYLYSQERWERGLLMEIFYKNTSPEVARTIWTQREQILQGGRIRSDELTATVLFSDIRGFTSISECLSPQGLMEWLNKYMDAMTRLIMEYGGVVDDYAGDGIKADFGVPLPRTTKAAIRQDARNAVNCALAMGKELSNLNNMWQEQGLPRVAMRVGINTGAIVAGTIGSADRIKYTTIGDAVNLAARLESLKINSEEATDDSNRLCRIFVSGETRQYLGESHEISCVGTFPVKGRTQTVSVYLVTEKAVGYKTSLLEEEQTCASENLD